MPNHGLKKRLERVGRGAKRTSKKKTSIESATSARARRSIAVRKRTDDVLRASEERFRALIEKSTDGIALLSATGTLLYASPAYEQIFGYTTDDLVNIGANELIDPADRGPMAAQVARLLEKPDEEVRARYRIRHKDGSWRWVELIATNLLAEPSVQAIVINYRDVTESMQAEHAWQQAEEKYRSIFEHAVEGIFQSTPEGRFLSVNPALARMWGYASPQELIASITDIAHQTYADPANRAEFKRLIEEQGEVHGFEFQVRRKDGSVMWVSENARAVRDAAGALLYYEGTTEDITPRKQAEQELQRRADEFAALYETTRDLAQMQDLPTLLQLIVQRAIHLLAGSGGGMYIYDAARGDLEVRVATNSPTPVGTRLQFGEGMAGRVAQTREPLIVDDYSAWRHRSTKYSSPLLRAIVEVPMLFGGELIGVLVVEEIGETTRKFTEQNARLLSLFASQAASAVYNAQLLAETQRRADEFAALYETTRDLTMQQDVPALLRTIVDRAANLLSAPGGGIYLYNDERGELTMIAPKGNDAIAGLVLRLGEGLAGRVAQTRQPIIIDDYRTWEHRSPQYNGIPVTAVVQVPMLYRGDLIGVLAVHEVESTTRKFTDSDARLLSLFAGQAASAIFNARLVTETKRHADELEALYDATRELAMQNDLSALLQTILDHATILLHAPGAFVYLFDPVRHNLEMRTVKGISVPVGTRLELGEGVAGRVAQSHQPLIVDDYHAWEYRSKQFDDSPFRAGVQVPMLYRGVLIGVLAVTEIGSSVRKFTDADARLLSLLAGHAASAVRNAQLFEEAQRHADEMTALQETALGLVSRLEIRPLLETVIRRATELLGSTGSLIYQWEEPAQQLRCTISYNLSRDYTHVTLQPGEGLAGRVYQTGQPLIVNNYAHWEGRAAVLRDIPTQAVIGVPLLWNNRVIGVLNVNDESGARTFDEQDVRLLTLFANHAAVAIENARLYEAEEQHAARLTESVKLGTELATLRDEDSVLKMLVARAAAIAESVTCTVMLVDAETDHAVLAAETGLGVDKSAQVRVPLALPIIRHSLETGEPIILPNIDRDAPAIRSILVRTDIHAFFAYPMARDGRTLGFLTLSKLAPYAPSREEIAVYQLLAERAAAALETARLFEETRRRLAELEAVNRISTALRAAQTLEEMLPLLLGEIRSVLNVSAVSIWLHDASTGKLRQVAEHGFPHIDSSLKTSEGIAGHVFTTGEMYLSREFKTDPLTEESKRALVPTGLGGACVPIRAADQVIGALFVSVQLPRHLSPGDTHLLTTVTEIAGNAIHRTRLHEQTEQQLQRLDALHTIDKTITSSLDLRVTLGVILKQVTSQLGADAASVLLLNPHTKTLEFAAGHGFRTRAIERQTPHLGEGLAGRAALERHTVSTPNLAEQSGLPRAALFAAEGFTVYYGTPLVAKGQVKGVLEVFKRTPLVTQTDWLPFLETLAEQAAIAIDSIGLFQDLQRSNMELSLAYDTTLEGWSRALDLRDRETEGHAQRVVELTLRLAREMGIGESELVHIRRGVLLHDIGKMAISDGILHKPGPLAPEEMAIMRKHPEYAFELLAPIQYLQRALDVPYCHHEKWDGTGYPRGLKGEEIPLAARIFAVVDVWDALSSDRPYRAAWTEDRVRAYIREQTGLHFDPQVVETFFRVIAMDK